MANLKYWDFKDEYFGCLLPYIEDKNVTDINYYHGHTWIDDIEKGRYPAKELVLTPEFLNQFSTRVANTVSANFNQQDNILEAETPELRISIVHDSVTADDYGISIRKTPAVVRLTSQSILSSGYCTNDILFLLINCVKAHMNIVFCGLPGSGKTELLKFLTRYIPKDEKVVTIEDTFEIHYSIINPEANCLELKVNRDNFSYTKALKTVLRQNASHVILSEARSTEVEYLMEAFSTGLNGMTTLHTDDVRKIPERITNMMHSDIDSARLKDDIFSFINVGVLIRKRVNPKNGKMERFVSQVCFFDSSNGVNSYEMVVDDRKVIPGYTIPENLRMKLKYYDVNMRGQ